MAVMFIGNSTAIQELFKRVRRPVHGHVQTEGVLALVYAGGHGRDGGMCCLHATMICVVLNCSILTHRRVALSACG
jgi:hypothetical protein